MTLAYLLRSGQVALLLAPDPGVGKLRFRQMEQGAKRHYSRPKPAKMAKINHRRMLLLAFPPKPSHPTSLHVRHCDAGEAPESSLRRAPLDCFLLSSLALFVP